MLETTTVVCAIQAILTAYLGWVLAHGAKSKARKTLAWVQWGFCGYNVGLLLGPWVGRLPSNFVGLSLAVFGMFQLSRFARWYAAGAEPEVAPPSSSILGAAALVAASGLAALGLFDPARTLSAVMGLLLLLLAFATWSLFALARAHLAGVPRCRSYMLACLCPILSLLSSFGYVLHAPIPQWFHALFMRDLAMLAFEFLLLVSYLDSGHEPISLRERVVSGILMALFALATIAAHLVLPLAPNPVAQHAGAVRMMILVGAASLVVVLVTPRLFRKSILDPLAALLAGLEKAEAGERVALPIERRDELGGVARAFNTMVAGLADGRAALGARLAEIQARQTEIESLNEELRRQIAARSRQLGELLSKLDLKGERIQIGALVDDRYRVEDQLGAGAMGVVFDVRRMGDEKRFALKTLLGGAHDDAVRFTREAEIAATIHHPHVVSIVDVGIHRHSPYFVMEYLSQGTLADSSHRFGDFAWVLPLLEDVASGLTELHARGVLHRDLKPANVLLDGDPSAPRAKIGDLGIARADLAQALADTAEAGSGRRVAGTAPGALLGTYPYMAPELARGAAAYTAHSDVFSFGVLAWEVSSGALPFRMPPVVASMSGLPLPEPLPMPDDAPAELTRLLVRCLAREPENRPTARDIVTALHSIAETLPASNRGRGAHHDPARDDADEVNAFAPTVAPERA